ncbi:2532_t:CDS:1 [Diversispora eburnea]|uniref:2532_t:CDS:1 n=1 Tax=Diversispora eburnea TaxID=1213867 RepID=A0A9N8ZLD8_9GLOM|nr:2532_t:CDS:1 [Diversispora eburnea]
MSTSEEIVEIHLNNGLENGNRTMNAFMIYRKDRARKNPNRSWNNSPKLASESWKNESNKIKDHYKRMAENVKKGFKKKIPYCFIHSNLAGTDGNETNPHTILHNSSDTTYCNPPMDKNSPNIDQNISDTINHNPINIQQTYPQGITYYNPPMDENFPDIINHNSSNIQQTYPQGITFPNSVGCTNIMGQNYSDTTYCNRPMDKNCPNIDQNISDTINHNPSNIQQTYPQVITFPNSVQIICCTNVMDQNYSYNTYYNLPVDKTSSIINQNISGINHNLTNISSQQTYSHMKQNLPGTIFPNPDQIIDYYPFIDINQGIFFYHMDQNISRNYFPNPDQIINSFTDINKGTSFSNSLPSNSLNTIYSQQSVNMGQLSMNQNSPDINCPNLFDASCLDHPDQK